MAYIGVKPVSSLNFPVTEQMKFAILLRVVWVLFLSFAIEKYTVASVNTQTKKTNVWIAYKLQSIAIW